jgi:heme-degrading monooxygenase HmoA
MVARHVTIRLRPDSVAKFARIVETEVTPLLRRQDGFLRHYTLLSLERAEAIVITLWDSKEAEEAFNRTQNPELSRSLLEVVEGTPKVDLFEVMVSD